MMQFLKIGHRGASADVLENTIESFQAAISSGVDAVEFDVRRSKDGRMVLSHDEDLRRAFGKNLLISDLTLHEIRELTGGKIPTLEEAIDLLRRKVDRVFIEIKEAGYEAEILQIIADKKFSEKVVIISFNEESLRNIRKLDQEIKIGLSCKKPSNHIGVAKELGATYLVVKYKYVDSEFIENVHHAGLKLIVWTVDDLKTAQRLYVQGVDGIIGDDPAMLSKIEL